MPSLDGLVVDWMRTHQTTVSTSSLDAAGVTETRRRRLVTAGQLLRVLDGGYQFAGAGVTELSRCAALCTSRPHLVIAGPTAGRLHGIRRSPRDHLVHFISPPASQPCREPWAKPYRTAALDERDVVERIDGIRVTSASRAVVDLTRYLPDAALASAIEHALAAGIATVESLCRVAERMNTRGRPWVRRFLRVLSSRNPGRPRESDWERRVHDALVARGVGELESQVSERLPGIGAVRFDFAIRTIRWVLEVDVHPEHRTVEGQSNDLRRSRKGRAVGWHIERAGENELAADFDGVIDDLVDSITQRRVEFAALAGAGLWLPAAER